MAEAIQATVRCQVGKETTVKTGVAAGKELQTLQVSSWKPELDIAQFPGSGLQHMQGTGLNRKWGSFKLGGPIDFNEINYIHGAAGGAATITTPSNGVLTRKFVTAFPHAYAVRAQQSLTVEHGSSVKAEKVTGAFCTGFSYKLARENPSVESDWLASNHTRSITFTSTPSRVGTNASKAVGQGLKCYKDTSFGSLGTTQYAGKVFDATFDVSGLASVSWPLDRGLATWDAIIDQPNPTFEMMWLVEADATGSGIQDDAESGTTHYLRAEVQGTLIEAVTPNYNFLLQIDMAGQISAIDDYGPTGENVRAFGVHWVPVYDASLAPTITVFTTVTAL